MITLENYVLEQEINDSSFFDVVLEQAIAEFEVASAILDCAIKQEMIQEYTSTDVLEFGVFQEGEKWDKFKAKTKGKWSDFKAFLERAWKMLVAAIDKFIDSLSHTKFKNLIKKVEKDVPDDATFDIDTSAIHRFQDVETYIEMLADFRDDDTINYDTYLSELKQLGTNINKLMGMVNETYETSKHTGNPLTGENYKETRSHKYEILDKDSLIRELKACDELQSTLGGYRTIRRKFELKKFNPPAEASDSMKKYAREIKDEYTKIIKNLCAHFVDSAKTIKNIVNAIAKDQKTAAATSKTDPAFRYNAEDESKARSMATGETEDFFKSGGNTEIEDKFAETDKKSDTQ